MMESNNIPKQEQDFKENNENINLQNINSMIKNEKENNNIGNSNHNQNPFIQSTQKIIKQYKYTKTLTGHENRIVSMIRLSSGYLVTGAYDNSIRIWDITKSRKEALIDVRYSVGYILCLLELEPNKLYAGNSLNSIDIFNLNEKSVDPYSRLFGHLLWVVALTKCDEKHFASASNDAKIIIWDSEKDTKIRELVGHTDCILTMILLNNGNLCTGSADKTIRFWNWKSGNCLNYFEAHDSWVKCVYQFNDDTLLSGSDDKKINIWDMDRNLKGVLKGHTHSVRTFCKIDDNYFASGSFDNTIKIWDFNEKNCVQTLEGHSSNVICVIKYDNKLISCSSDRTIKIWEEI